MHETILENKRTTSLREINGTNSDAATIPRDKFETPVRGVRGGGLQRGCWDEKGYAINESPRTRQLARRAREARADEASRIVVDAPSAPPRASRVVVSDIFIYLFSAAAVAGSYLLSRGFCLCRVSW